MELKRNIDCWNNLFESQKTSLTINFNNLIESLREEGRISETNDYKFLMKKILNQMYNLEESVNDFTEHLRDNKIEDLVAIEQKTQHIMKEFSPYMMLYMLST